MDIGHALQYIVQDTAETARQGKATARVGKAKGTWHMA